MDQLTNRVLAATFGAWFCFALALGVSGRFQSVGALGIAGIVWGLTVLLLLACRKIELFRNWIAALPLARLVAPHLVRFVGIYFLVLASQDRLPKGFAEPAGIGDILVAIGAVALLVMPTLQTSLTVVRAWNFFGFIDIVFVVFAALRSGLQDWVSMAPLRELPLSLLPTFFVPIIIVSHILIFIRVTAAGKLSR